MADNGIASEDMTGLPALDGGTDPIHQEVQLAIKITSGGLILVKCDLFRNLVGRYGGTGFAFGQRKLAMSPKLV